MMLRLLLLTLACAAGLAQAEVKPFAAGSLAQIRAAREGRPFILAFWSLECAHCPKELKILGEVKRRYPKADLVLVSTDTPADAAALAEFADRQGLGAAEQWVFADQPQKLRFEVDRRWWGELPRTYLFDATHKAEGHSGLIDTDTLGHWLARSACASAAASVC